MTGRSRCRKLLVHALNFHRLLYFKLLGVRIPFSAVIRKGAEISGNVTIGAGVYIDKDARINGKISIGERSRIWRSANIKGNVDIGCDSEIGNYTTVASTCDGYFKIGDDVMVNQMSILGACDRVEIKDHCIFAAFIQITDSSRAFEDPSVLIKNAEFISAPVLIEEGVWLGTGVAVMKGVTIGEGAVVGAKSLVLKSIPSYSVAYGTPARVVRNRGSKLAGQT